jgi:hypothetical protein
MLLIGDKFPKPRGAAPSCLSIPPEVLEAIGRKLGVSDCVLDVLVPEPSL